MSDDLIKRSDAIKAFVEETNGVNVEKAIKVVDAYLQIRECDEVWDSIRAIRDCLEGAKDEIAEYIPSADRPIVDKEYLTDLILESVYDGEACAKLLDLVDRPQGEWVDMGDFEQCSVCKGTHLKEFQSYYGKTTWIKTPYCPACGARMLAKDTNVPNKKGADDESVDSN